MEIQELIFFYLHENSNQVEVQFRLNVDSDEELRTDFINVNEALDFGYDIIMEENNFLSEDDDEDIYWLDSPTLDEENLISFLNEYYVVNSDKLPKPELI